MAEKKENAKNVVWTHVHDPWGQKGALSLESSIA
jgi:hypothetical protein